MTNKINSRVLMSGADFFDDGFAINAYMDSSVKVDVSQAVKDHAAIEQALRSAGVDIVKVAPPESCQDGVYTANWGLCRNNKAVLSSLPSTRQAEQSYAKEILERLGYSIMVVPSGLRFSGQGDALPCGDYLLAGSRYRTDQQVHKFLAENLDYQVISLQTVPLKDSEGNEVLNAVTGWPDSHFYDIDLALAVLSDELIAWCPDAFLPESQDRLAKLPMQKIEVSLDEAVNGLACNLISTGESVVMSGNAPLLASQIETHGLKTIHPKVSELQKGGGFIRCTTLTLN